MDLLATVRKEGSRGGRGDFKWTDVQNSTHRENYLGHSLMAPVGRWQKGRDLNWYTKADDDNEDAAERAARERKEELRKIKEAESDAMARALGLPVPDRSNANLEEVSNKRDFDRVLKEAVGENSEQAGKGVGFDNKIAGDQSTQILSERVEGNAEAQDRELQYALKEYKRRHGDRKHQRSRDTDRDDGHRRRDKPRQHRSENRHSHSSGHKDRHKRKHSRSKSRSRSRSRSRDRERGTRRRDRSRSPYQRDDDRRERRRRRD